MTVPFLRRIGLLIGVGGEFGRGKLTQQLVHDIATGAAPAQQDARDQAGKFTQGRAGDL